MSGSLRFASAEHSPGAHHPSVPSVRARRLRVPRLREAVRRERGSLALSEAQVHGVPGVIHHQTGAVTALVYNS